MGQGVQRLLSMCLLRALKLHEKEIESPIPLMSFSEVYGHVSFVGTDVSRNLPGDGSFQGGDLNPNYDVASIYNVKGLISLTSHVSARRGQ